MLTKETIMQIRILSRRGMSVRAIARALSLACNTRRKYRRGMAVTKVEWRGPGSPHKQALYAASDGVSGTDPAVADGTASRDCCHGYEPLKIGEPYAQTDTFTARGRAAGK